MGLFDSMAVSATGLTAQRLRLDVIANNLANVMTTRSAEGGPYRRRQAVLAAREPLDFAAALARARNAGDLNLAAGQGVMVATIATDQAPLRLKYDPTHPDAGDDGFVRLPNVDVLTEMTELMGAARAYEANITALNAAKAMATRALEIGR